MQLNDWSTHMMQVQILCKGIEHSLLHKKYHNVADLIHQAKDALDQTEAWLVTKGSNAGADIVPMLESAAASMKATDEAKPFLLASIQEIQQLRGEREFWLQAGYKIGSSGE